MSWGWLAGALMIGSALAAAVMWRYRMLRTWRTAALLVAASLVAGALIMAGPNGALVAVPVVGLGFWLVARKPVPAQRVDDRLFAERFRQADERARQIVTSPGNAEPKAIAALDEVIKSLSWDRLTRNGSRLGPPRWPNSHTRDPCWPT